MARKNNTNALTHGLYAKHFADDAAQDALKKMPMDDLRQEIVALRIIGEKIIAEIQVANTLAQLADSFVNIENPQELIAVGEKILAEIQARNNSADILTKLANSFVNATTAIATLMRTQALLHGTYNPLDDAINQALKGFNPYEEVPGSDSDAE